MNNSIKALAFSCIAIPSAVYATPNFAAVSDKQSYDMTITRYATLSDAQNQTNATSGPHVLVDPQTNDRRDNYVYITQNHPDFGSNDALFGTAWYYTTVDNTNGLPKDDPGGDRLYSGWGNPNNTNTGFFQLYDEGSASVTLMDGSWTSLGAGSSTFHVDARWENHEPFARLWPAPLIGGAGALSSGKFIEANLDYTASGMTAVWNGALGMYESFDHPVTVSGTMTGIFQNTNTSDPAYNGFYVFTMNLNSDSWAYAQGDAALNGDFSDSYFAAVPEPGTFAVLALAGLAALRRRKK